MMPDEKQDYLVGLISKYDDERRKGAVDIVKVILSIVSVLLTVLATLDGRPTPESHFCSQPLQFLARNLMYPLLFSCFGVCVYHLYYALSQCNTKMASLVSSALDKSDSFETAFEYLKRHNAIDHPWFYKKSLPIIFALFGCSIMAILLRVS